MTGPVGLLLGLLLVSPVAGGSTAARGAVGLTYEQLRAGRAILGVLGLLALGYVAFRAWRARRRTP